MSRKSLIVGLWLSLVLLPSASLGFELGARGSYWFPTLDGTLRVDQDNLIGTSIDFDKDLGIENENFPSVEVFGGIGNHHISLAFTDVDYSGTKTLTRNIVFNGSTFTVNALVASSIEYKMIDFRYQYDFLNLENVLAGFSLGGVFQVKYFDGEVRLTTTGLDQKEDFSIPVPMFGLNLHLGILADILEARLRGTGITYSGNSIYEVMGEISLSPLPYVSLQGGYKAFFIDIDQSDVLLDYHMAGPFVSLTLSF